MLRFLGAALLLLGSASAPAAELFPFSLPWDDNSPTVISLAHLNDKPAGRDGFVQVKDGHLFAGEKRLRIFGVNVCFGANFPTHQAAEKIAARMAKFGINCVRFHHMDMFSAPAGIFAKDGKTLDPERLDRLDYFIAKLKEHGIYSDLNLHVSRTHPDRPKSEKKGNPSYDKGVDNYSPAMIALQKDFARDLLHHKNAYTGNRYADEPAIAIVEINNENALGFQWWAGEMDDLPAVYRSELEKLWGDWVTAKYKGDEAAKAAWSEGARAPGADLLPPDTKWFHEQHGGAAATAGQDGRRIRVEVQKPGTESWHVQFSHAGMKFAKGETYEVRLRARAPKSTSISIGLQQAHAPWKILGSANVTAGPEWADLSAVIKTSEADDQARLGIGGMGQTPGVFEFESISLRVGGVDGTVARAADGGLPMLRKREFARHSAPKQRDWQQFLWDTETAYWNGMRDFLKKELGVKAPVVGTQGFWSPAHVQAGMDIIDSHAYWHHPDFHGRGWNQEVWTVKNESMAGAPDGGELARLAAQRVEGKPFICTEYMHPSPNTYSAETFPLLLAFAAAQDWDGVFAFSYSHRTDEWDQGHFNNFFDIDRHSVKMATLPGAVLSFRRGDVRALAAEAILSISPRDALDSAIRGGPGFTRSRPEFKETYLFTTRFATLPKLSSVTKLETRASGEIAPPQLEWASGLLAAVDSPRSVLFVGRMTETNGQTPEFKRKVVTIRPGETRQGWGCYQVTALEGDDLAGAKRILITATGETANTDMQWKGPERTSVGRNWGKAPVLVEGPAATITFPGRKGLRAWALDETGARRAEVPMQDGAIKIGPEHRTLWYELAHE